MIKVLSLKMLYLNTYVISKVSFMLELLLSNETLIEIGPDIKNIKKKDKL